MKNSEAVKIGLRGLWSRARGWPLCVSFEVTHSCVADCLHCDKGGIKAEKRLMPPQDYARMSRELRPGVCQLSGGEPLLREDLEEIVRALKRPSGLPLVVLVSNWWLMTEERFDALSEAGVSLFSISLDFPDERHDDFRRLRGLYAKLSRIVPALVAKHGRERIVLNAALTQANFREIPGLVAKAEEWGTQISFSAYSSLRTGDTSLCIDQAQDLATLRAHFDWVKQNRGRPPTVLNSDYVLEQTYRFFAEGGMSGCQAGRRFLVVRPDGLLNGCSMYPDLQYRTRAEVAEGFRSTRENCDRCFVSIRASTERPLARLIEENARIVFRLPAYERDRRDD